MPSSSWLLRDLSLSLFVTVGVSRSRLLFESLSLLSLSLSLSLSLLSLSLSLSFFPGRLDGKHVVFGSVTDGMDVVKMVESYGSQQGKTSKKIVIADCGQLS